MDQDLRRVRSETDMERWLREAVETVAEENDEPAEADIDTFDGRGILTRNRGIVIKLANGAEFQVSIVQSANAAGDDEDEEGGRT